MGEKESQDIRDIVLKLLQTNEELKSTVEPLIKGQDYAQRALESHQKSLMELMGKLTGLSKGQETMQKELSELKEYVVDKKFVQELTGQIGRLENVCISNVLKKIQSEKEKDISEAELKEFEAFVQKKSDPMLYMLLGTTFAQLGQIEKALACLEESLKLDSKNVHARCYKGMLLESLKKHKEALEIFETLDEPKECRTTVLRMRAYSTAVLGQPDRALELISLAIESDSNDAQSWALKGRILTDMKRDMEALGCLGKALDIEPNYVLALSNKGFVLTRLGSSYRKEALECFNKAISIQKNDAILMFNRGHVLQELGMDKEAIKDFDAAIDLDSKNGCTFCLRGLSKTRLGEHKDALSDFNKAFEIGIRKGCAGCHQYRATALASLGKDKEALEEIDEAMKIDDKDANVWAAKADLLIGLKRTEEAKGSLEVALKLKPDDAFDLNNIAYQLYRIGENSAGLELVRKALEREPDQVNFLDTLACILSGLGQNQDSLEVYKRALEFRQDDGQITWNELAKVHEKLGNREEAERIRKEHVDSK
jgi:tetratricopeptide (TPR) repeat protein